MHPKNVVEKCISGAMADVVEHVLGKVVQRNLIKASFHLPEYFQVYLRGTFFPKHFKEAEVMTVCDVIIRGRVGDDRRVSQLLQ